MDLELSGRHPVRRYKRNTVGRDIAVGDIHGQFSKLARELAEIQFNPLVDRLFAVGDLVDRGPESHMALKWLNAPENHSVCGNHDDYIVRFDEGGLGKWLTRAGKWFNTIPPHRQEAWGYVMNKLPVVIEVETSHGLIGIVHAECPTAKWKDLTDLLESPIRNQRYKDVRNACMWRRRVIKANVPVFIEGIRALVVGHEPVSKMYVLGNIHYIDTTGGKDDRKFTFLDLNTLKVIER